MDRERLQQVQQSDLSESRVNEDFVNWIKTSGPWYLLAILVGIAVYLYLVNLQRAEVREHEQAWFDFTQAAMPASLEDVAQQHGDVDSIGTLARLRAANTYLASLQTNLAVGSTLEEGTPLTAEDRALGLDRAGDLYRQVAESDKGGFGDTITAYTALNGLAAVAECQGDVDSARKYYEQAATRAQEWYPVLADQARGRAETVDEYAADITLPKPASPLAPPAIPGGATLQPLDVDNILNLPAGALPGDAAPPAAPTGTPAAPAETPAAPAADDTAPPAEAPATEEEATPASPSTDPATPADPDSP
ncbi:MAG: hypothetical protein MK116_11785 [Phycisphaerales bacterium]|nr:hypothetical protein [Phycisphaerales bacterium]